MIRCRRPAALALAAALAGCAIHHVTPYVPDAANTPQTADAVEASTGCFEATTTAERAICADAALVDANRALLRALQADLRTASLFGRDALLAGQRAWLVALPQTCHLPPLPEAAGPGAKSCVATALASRTEALRATVPAAPPSGPAIAQYVALRPSAGAGPQPDPAFCASLSSLAQSALRRTGTLDPAAMGWDEVAGTHGAPTGTDPRHRVAVELYDANAYALFQRRARALSLDGGPPAITPISLTRLVQARAAANQGGRFSAYASQTGDYGSIDAFRAQGRLLAMVADPWGSTTPAAPGEAAHAGVWDISGVSPAPLCLFDIYTRPAEVPDLPALTPWRVALAALRDAGPDRIGAAATRDGAQLAADTDFIVLQMPLLATEQAGGGWTPWLRHRHDAVLDSLFAWSQADPTRKTLFDQVLAGLRPAALDLVRFYQTVQGLSGQEATQAAGLAIMELLYQATVTIDPGLGADPAAPGSAAGLRPRYPILATPG
jgi:uncharacterized protein YecT (DUF1311 family)